ncbi:carbohydrate-binding protein [Paenibacillus pinihumi]|uniref:carbohydrate-binding protein n=1 Tax=Paenibacillus pinihumi TaxID=669462 RepID=UPI000416D7C2|nr:carbohydrate-binding protein [Paenibacillus pinihumi]
MKRTRKFTAISLAFLLAFLTFGDMTKVQAESGNETPNEIEITADSEQVPAKEDESLDLAQLRNGNEALNNTLGPVQSYEGEAPGNTFTGNAGIHTCSAIAACSGGKKIGNLWGGSSVTFNNVNVATAGVYVLKLFYISEDSRALKLTVNNGEPDLFTPPTTPNWDTIGTFELEIELNAGNNAIKFDDNGGWSPDIDKIEIRPSSNPGPNPGNNGAIGNIGPVVNTQQFGSVTVNKHSNGVAISNGTYTVTYNTNTGLSAYDWNGSRIATGVYSTVKLGTSVLANTDYTHHNFSMSSIESVNDGHGTGIKVVIENKKNGLPTMKQIYHVYENLPYFVASQEVQSSSTIETNNMAPIVINAAGGVDLGSYGDNRVLITPFDNDMWSRYQARSMNTYLNAHRYISSEVTAIYDNSSRKGLVVGSITHDTWKTGISWGGSNNRLNQLNVFGGFTSVEQTHDTIAHGAISGTTLKSPQIFVGYYDDYRNGMEGYGRANAAVAPPLAFGPDIPQGVPFGWNSWGAYAHELSFSKVVDVSNFFKDYLQDNSFNNNGNVYINLDSYWDWLSPQELADVADIIRDNGQKPGIYDGPFVYWGDNMQQTVEGTNGQYTYGDIVLRDYSGNILPKVDGAYAIDPTHPGAKMRTQALYNRFLSLGFEYIKIDFLSHASFEGKHYDPNVKTGIQAYNQGLAFINQVLDGKMFISASIAPLFPSQYAHARRISCDIYGSLDSTEYQLNNLTYGWWQNGTIYHYTDPDYMTLEKGGSLNGAQSRVTAAAISGTVFLNSDNVSKPIAQQYMQTLLTNPRINELAAKGKAFRPIEGNTGTASTDQFILKDGNDYYLAVFNFTHSPVTKTVNLARAGISGASSYTVQDLWTNATTQHSGGQLSVQLGAAQSKLFKITP